MIERRDLVEHDGALKRVTVVGEQLATVAHGGRVEVVRISDCRRVDRLPADPRAVMPGGRAGSL